MLRGLALLGSAIFADAACYDGSGGFTSANWPQCVEASSAISVYSGLSQDGMFVKLGMHAVGHTKGWSGLGFAGNGGMKGASQIVVRLDDNYNWVAEDRYSLDYVMPTLDPQQDVKLLFAQDNGANTSWGVIIPKDDCDVNDYSVENVSRTFLWALGASHTFAQHATRGQFHANLISGIVPFAPLTGVTQVSLRMNTTVVSASSDLTNPYICGIFDLRVLIPGKNFSDKVHIAKFSPYLDPVSASYVHHMILYACDSNSGFVHGTIIPSCQSMPAGCNSFKWVWAVGAQDVQLPDNVGMPVGEGYFFVALQMHYYNPALINVVDTSGVALSVVDTLRPIDAGLMQLNGGTSPNLRPDLPANTPTFTLDPPLIVPATCTNYWTSPINVVGAIHHMHLTGVHQQIEVARNGTNLGVMRYERIYDFKHQSLEEPLVHVLYPGDEIKVTCQYNTVGKMVNTSFGENTDNEMCWSALMYYPAQAFTNAVVQPTPSLQELVVAGAPCTDMSSEFAAYNISLCAQLYWDDPVGFLFNYPVGLHADAVCNNVSQTPSWTSIYNAFPALCPPCWQNYDCTQTQLVTYGQAVICPNFYCPQLDLTVYPDQTKGVVYHSQRTYCDGPGNNVYGFDNTFPAAPACVQKGSIGNTQGVNTVATPIMTVQNACPNAAIRGVFTMCASSDLDLVGGTNNCKDSCRNATVTLSAALAAMSPVPTGDQTMKCISDYNATWAPAPVWKQWTTLDTRLRATQPICDPAKPGVSSASQFVPMSLGALLLACLVH